MAIEFIDDCDWKPVTLPVWSCDSYGTDIAKVICRGASVKKQDFEDSLVKFSKMPGFDFMFLKEWQSSIQSPSFPALELTYIGFRRGEVPPVHIDDGTSIQSAQGQGTNPTNGDQVSGTFLYKASRTTYTWFETTKPDRTAPRYSAANNPISPFNNIIKAVITVQNDDGTSTPGWIDYSDFVTVFNSLVAGNFVSDFDMDQLVPNKLWACKAVIDYKLE